MDRDRIGDRMSLRYIGLAVVIAAVGCGDSGVIEGPDAVPQEGRIVVQDDRAVLGERVRVVSQPLAIIPVGPTGAPPMTPADGSLSLVLVAEVAPPAVDGTTLQASHSVIHGNKAYVSYNVQGAVRKGGVDVFDVSDPDNVGLESSALFQDTDVSALDLQGATKLYLATATDDLAFATPAALEVVELTGGLLTTQSSRIDLPSYAGTGVRAQGDLVYVTSGTGGDPVGGLSVYDRETLGLVAFDPFEDARAVAVKNDVVVAMRGTPGELRLYDATTNGFVQSFASGGANIPESKATVFIAKSCAFYAAGDEGLRVVDLGTGATVVTMPVPDVDGVALEDEVTNGVSASGKLVFLANGGAGLFVAQATHDLDAVTGEGCGSSEFGLVQLGQVQFSDGRSANFVVSKGNLLFVANGLGGLSIIRVDHSDGG